MPEISKVGGSRFPKSALSQKVNTRRASSTPKTPLRRTLQRPDHAAIHQDRLPCHVAVHLRYCPKNVNAGPDRDFANETGFRDTVEASWDTLSGQNDSVPQTSVFWTLQTSGPHPRRSERCRNRNDRHVPRSIGVVLRRSRFRGSRTPSDGHDAATFARALAARTAAERVATS
jgi:hypothetical protein